MRTGLVTLFLICGSMLFARPAKANIIWFETTSSNGNGLFGSSDALRDSELAMEVTLPTAYTVCNVRFLLYREAAAVPGVTVTLTVHRSYTSIAPDFLSFVEVESSILETTIPANPGGAGPWTTYTNFDFTLGDPEYDYTGCIYLRANVLYSFILKRSALVAGSSPLSARNRSTDQFAYSNEWKKSGVGLWASHYPYETIMRIEGIYAGAPAEDEAVLRYLFVPNQASLDMWTDQLDDLESRVPWGYFYLMRDELFSITTTTQDLYFEFTEEGDALTPVGETIISMNVTDLYENIPQNVRDWSAFALYCFLWIEAIGFAMDTYRLML